MSKPTVLLIEDDPWFSQHQSRVLREAGFEVGVAADGVAGMAAIDGSVPDAIVMDMFLPGPNGLVLLHELQSHSDLSDIPIILCSNSSTEVNQRSLAAYGVRDVLDKGTMRPQDLVAAVKREVL